MPALLNDPNFWAAIAASGGAISAIAALCAIWQSRMSARDAREAQRPYFLLEAPGIKPLPNAPPFRVMITLKNSGARPATLLEGRIFMVPVSTGATSTLDTTFSVGNPVPANSPTPWYYDSLVLPTQCSPHYILLGIEYVDPLPSRRYRQAFFMRWDGVQNGTAQPDFVHVSVSEKAMLAKRFESIIGPYEGDG